MEPRARGLPWVLVSEPPVYSVRTLVEDQPVAGCDSIIASMPDGLYVTVEGKKALAVQMLGRWLRMLAERSVESIGERLHHAEFVITGDPEVVRTRGLAHDCVECRAGVDKALAALAENPQMEMAVGTLFWAGRV